VSGITGLTGGGAWSRRTGAEDAVQHARTAAATCWPDPECPGHPAQRRARTQLWFLARLLAVIGHPGELGPTIGHVPEYLLIRHHSAVGLVNRTARAGILERVSDPGDAAGSTSAARRTEPWWPGRRAAPAPRRCRSLASSRISSSIRAAPGVSLSGSATNGRGDRAHCRCRGQRDGCRFDADQTGDLDGHPGLLLDPADWGVGDGLADVHAPPGSAHRSLSILWISSRRPRTSRTVVHLGLVDDEQVRSRFAREVESPTSGSSEVDHHRFRHAGRARPTLRCASRRARRRSSNVRIGPGIILSSGCDGRPQGRGRRRSETRTARPAGCGSG
jgi:hypothetical protein